MSGERSGAGAGESIAVADSGAGYIDNAIPGNIVRFRSDDGFRNNRPSRAEFFYPKGGAVGPGLPRPESKVDFQELTLYVEGAVTPRLSGFIESGYRLINPEVNANANGFGDLNAGFKFAFIRTDDTVATLQFRTYAPTGDSEKGLGTHHVSLEPAFLLFQRLNETWSLNAELRYWAPVGGTDFAGDIVRYGLGVRYGKPKADQLWINPVAEVVGWSVLNGKELVITPNGAKPVDASGDTIVNLKLGARLGFGTHADLYAGYGRAVTGAVWYKEIARFEFRLLF